ncbi:nuclease-related domain-containing protein [Nonomuraea soli]|uniref:NERD domain-containing protein n=1 Tax=Nonomuraea soli TaxID=1032476 RepID=A0A7W0CV55_9ACTN|nr:nuclease-related domain-containing protein [Nonomuraea soli]MBA2897755.1 hypothetical protein [Nonomuraea soli]
MSTSPRIPFRPASAYSASGADPVITPAINRTISSGFGPSDGSAGDGAGQAGASAHAQYRMQVALTRHRRLVLRTVEAALPAVVVGLLLGGRLGLAVALVVALVVAAVDWWRFHRWSAIASWCKGAVGERSTARLLAPLACEGYVILHDRAIAGSSANLDHLVVGPSGVFLIDSKKWARRTRISGHGARLWIGGRPAETLLRGLAFERSAVQRAIDHGVAEVAVLPVVAVHGPRLPGISRPLQVAGIMLVRAGQVRRFIQAAPKQLSAAQVAVLARRLDRLFPPYIEG